MPFGIVWICEEDARIYLFSDQHMSRESVEAFQENGANSLVSRTFFFKTVASRLGGLGKLLILGPCLTKHYFKDFIKTSSPDVARLIVGLDSLLQPTDGNIAQFASQYFGGKVG